MAAVSGVVMRRRVGHSSGSAATASSSRRAAIHSGATGCAGALGEARQLLQGRFGKEDLGRLARIRDGPVTHARDDVTQPGRAEAAAAAAVGHGADVDGAEAFSQGFRVDRHLIRSCAAPEGPDLVMLSVAGDADSSP
jgi:hypothetical protein